MYSFFPPGIAAAAVRFPGSVCRRCLSLVPVCHLWVIGRRLPVKYFYVFVGPQRHFLGVHEPAGLCLSPYPFIAVHGFVATDQLRGKRLCAKKYNGAVFLYHSPVLLPQLLQIDRSVPPAACCAIRQITQHHVNAAIRDPFHEFQAVAAQ